ncbi:MAG: hypothetical protein M3138_07340 [Actinomycetota bacterium]|nr:hypothetical protein [Actinomycetota bacterium]
MRFGPVVQEAIRSLQADRDLWEGRRGDACGLLLGKDEPVGYLGVPDEFRPFLSWGVDGVHEGLWIDVQHQGHAPYVVMVSPMDTDAIRVEARDVDSWHALLRLGIFVEHHGNAWEEEREAAIAHRRRLGLPSIPVQYDIPD